MADPKKISRRRMLTIAVGTAGTSIGAAIIVGTSTPAPAAGKVAQTIVKYQTMPKGEQHCENCLHFQPPSSCQTVDGTISPQGWCMVYAKKPA